MFDKLKDFLIEKKVIGDFSAEIKVIVPKDENEYKAKIEFYSENFPISKITPKSLVKVDGEKIFTIEWQTNRNRTTVMVIVKRDNKEILHKSFMVKTGSKMEVKI